MKGDDVMSFVITETQKREIENLAEKHSDALIAMGADMYRRGILTGALWTLAGVSIGVVSTRIYRAVKDR